MLDAVSSVLGLQYSQILKSTALHNENKEVKLKLDSVLNVTWRSRRRLNGYAASRFSITDVNHVTAVCDQRFLPLSSFLLPSPAGLMMSEYIRKDRTSVRAEAQCM